MENIETFDSPLLSDVQINSDGTLKKSGKQNVKFYRKKVLSFKARPLWVRHDDGEISKDAKGKSIQAKDEKGKLLFEIDSRTGLPFTDAYEEIKEYVRVETRGDTNIKDDVAKPLDQMQHNRQYRAFREGKIPDGHSIEDFEFLQPQTIMELHMYGIHTLEQCVDMDDLTCEQIKDQSGYWVREIAQQWLQLNSPNGFKAKADRMELENARLKAEIESLKMKRRGTRLVETKDPVIESLSEPEVVPVMELTPEEFKNRRGRPRKV